MKGEKKRLVQKSFPHGYRSEAEKKSIMQMDDVWLFFFAHPEKTMREKKGYGIGWWEEGGEISDD
jgi:hypothetical protein